MNSSKQAVLEMVILNEEVTVFFDGDYVRGYMDDVNEAGVFVENYDLEIEFVGHEKITSIKNIDREITTKFN